MPWLPVLHEESETRAWMRDVVLPNQEVLVAERDGRPVGFAAVDGDWLEQLYVAPEVFGTGVGRRLLDAVKDARPGGLSLHVFARNERARRFYEAAGFVLVAEGDGRDNEERTPDCTYRWEAPAPAGG
jgi:GNAT superfamily N-acetyltransferase